MGLIKDKEGIIEYACGGIYPKRLLLEIDGFNEWEENLIFYYNINVDLENSPSLDPHIPCFIFLEDGCIVSFFYGQLKHGGYKEFTVYIVQYVDLGNMKNGFCGFEELRQFIKSDEDKKHIDYLEDPNYNYTNSQLEVYIISELECSVFLRLKLKFKVKKEDQKKFVNDEQYFWYLSEKFREFIYNGEKY